MAEASASAPGADPAPAAAAAAAAPVAEPLNDPNVEQGLASTVALHQGIGEAFAAGAAAAVAVGGSVDDATTPVSLGTLRRWRKHAARANRAIATHARLAFVREDRLSVELAMLRIAARNEVLDREAHLARVLDRLREQRAATAGPGGGAAGASTSAGASGSASGSAGASGSTGASASASADDGAHRGSALDRAVASVQRVDAALAQLSPIGTTNLHGTPLVAHLLEWPLSDPTPDPPLAAAAAAGSHEPAAALTEADGPGEAAQ